MFQKSSKEISWTIKDASKKFPVCVERISRVFQGSCIGIKEVSCGYQEGFNQVSRVFHVNFKSDLEVS